MEIIEYKIQKGDTLESIAEKHNITVEELINFHNSKASLTQQFFGNEIPFHVYEIIVKKNKIESKLNFKEVKFIQTARYRCEQINTSKFNGNLAHFLDQKFQYLLKTDLELSICYVKLEDYKTESTPNTIGNVFDFIVETEKIKNNVYFNINEYGRVKQILNKIDIEKEWSNFKKTNFYEMPFIKSLQEANREAISELIKMGDTQFSKDTHNEEEYWRNFFYFICFDQYLYDREKYDELDFDFVSTVVPPLIIPLKIRYDKVSEQDHVLTVRKVAEAQLTNELSNKIKERYNELHKSISKYDFTQYKIIFRSTIEFDKKTRTILNGQVVLREEISDNVENECTYTIKKLENFTP